MKEHEQKTRKCVTLQAIAQKKLVVILAKSLD